MTCVVLDWVWFFFSSRRRHTRSYGDWSSDVCSSDLRFEALPVHPALQRVGVHGAVVHGHALAVVGRGLGGRIQEDTLVVHDPGAAHVLRRLEESNHGHGLLREHLGPLPLGVANKIPPLAAQKLTLGLWQVPHDAVHVGSEPLDVPARHDAPPVAARRATLLDHHVTDEGGGEDSAIHQDAVDFDEALGKGSHGWVFSIHSTGPT